MDRTYTISNEVYTMNFFANAGDTRFQLLLRAGVDSVAFIILLLLLLKTPLPALIIANDTYYLITGMIVLAAYRFLQVFSYLISVTRELGIVREYLTQSVAGKSHLAQVVLLKHPHSLVPAIHHVLHETRTHRHDAVIGVIADSYDQKVARVIGHIDELVSLGYLGTIVGILLALSLLDFSMLEAGNIKGAVAPFLGGVIFAMGSTAVGLIAKLFLTRLGTILEEGVTYLIDNVIKMEVYDGIPPKA